MIRRFVFFIPLRWVALAVLIAAGVPFMLALLSSVSRSAHAGEVTRTASWYAGHPAAMRAMVAACRDDPGHGWNHPDCINAKAGEARAALNEGRRRVGIAVPPTSPAYWRGNPDLSRQLFVCDRLAPADQGPAFCPAARAAAR